MEGEGRGPEDGYHRISRAVGKDGCGLMGLHGWPKEWLGGSARYLIWEHKSWRLDDPTAWKDGSAAVPPAGSNEPSSVQPCVRLLPKCPVIGLNVSYDDVISGPMVGVRLVLVFPSAALYEAVLCW